MKKKIKLYFLVSIFISLIIFLILTLLWINYRSIAVGSEALENYVNTTTNLVENIPEDKELFVKNLEKNFSESVRITLIDKNGMVVADSVSDFEIQAYHGDRPEVISAFANKMGYDTRFSETMGIKTIYVAKKWCDDYVLRFSMPLSETQNFSKSILPVLIIIIFLILLNINYLVNKLADRIIMPIEKMFHSMERKVFNPSKNNGILKSEYEELQPVIAYFETLASQISSYIKDIEEKNNDINNIMSSMKEGLIIVNNDLNIVMINNQGKAFIGATANYQNKNIIHIYRSENFIESIQYVKNNRSNKVVDVNDKKNIYRFFINAMDKEGIVILISDVTELVKLEKMRSDFVANVSHELKTPLTSIIGFSELIDTGIVTDENKIIEYNHKIMLESKRLILLVDDILKLSDIESGVKKIIETVSISEIFSYVFEILSAHIQEKNINYSIDGDIKIKISKQHINELIFNLVDNAVKYNSIDGKIEVQIFIDKDLGKCGFWISDTGIGIQEKEHNRVFERFYRVDKARSRKTGGTGLGLSIVKNIAELYGGNVTLRSIDAGTKFIVNFPVDILA